MKTRNEYKWTFEGLCPVDNGSDKYWATLETEKMVVVEDLLAYCEKHSTTPTFQEAWTTNLAGKFGGTVTLLGHHRGGVRITSAAEAESL